MLRNVTIFLMILLNYKSRNVPNSYIAYNDQIVAANSKVKNYKVTQRLSLIDYRTIER